MTTRQHQIHRYPDTPGGDIALALFGATADAIGASAEEAGPIGALLYPRSADYVLRAFGSVAALPDAIDLYREAFGTCGR
jgi:hypothetical protein